MTNQDFSKIYNGNVLYFNTKKHFGFIESDNSSYYFFLDVKKIKTENREFRKQKIESKIKAQYNIGDEVNFKLKLSNDKIEAYDIEYLGNAQRTLLLNEAAENDVLSGYLKKIEDKFFVKHLTTYIFIPVEIKKNEIDKDLIYENRINQLVQFELKITGIDKLKAIIVDRKLNPNLEKIQEIFEKQEVVNGCIKSNSKNGMMVDILGIDAFLPHNQIDVNPIADYDVLVGKTMKFKIIKFNKYGNFVISRIVILQSELKEKREQIVSNLEVGQILEGIVKGIVTYGVFVDLGGISGLIYISNLSWNKINNPNDILKLGDKINVKVLNFSFNEDKIKIDLGYKQLFPND